MKLAHTNDLLNVMALSSEELEELLEQAGYDRIAGIRLVARLAAENNLVDWPDTRTPEHYSALISAVGIHLQQSQI